MKYREKKKSYMWGFLSAHRGINLYKLRKGQFQFSSVICTPLDRIPLQVDGGKLF